MLLLQVKNEVKEKGKENLWPKGDYKIGMKIGYTIIVAFRFT